ncbi:Retrovirus-related Pol polyprotein from transposon opus [Araneus ventricosus]|uniref:Retrovirus-related Pol polyprotein from transposon opus n=1 Tax=Araneus ventricosus TaxID=182803 RepID=A0A4Y2GEJ1_ARAVE|nr:Retrovirus-related Pol polyprotein from transposon opus [Araneus ventricosus]
MGADFLERFELLIDVRNRRLLDGRTSLFVNGTLKKTKSLGQFILLKKATVHAVFCGDFQRLNSVTTPDRYPLPHIHDFVDGLKGKTVFSKIDLVKAYHQIPMNPRDIHKTAVITPIGLFEYVFMTFGLRNAAQTMQRYIDSIIRDIPSCYAYVDDLLISSVDQESHKSDLDLVFSKLSEHGIVVNPQKSVFGQSELKFLGFLVSSKGISLLPEKVQFLKEFPLPKTVQELRRFLATLNFYHRFLKDAAKEQACLHSLVKNKVKKENTSIAWTEDTRSAFESCKRLIANETALSFPAADARLSLMTDASDFAVGAVLQQHIESKVEPLGFFSRKLSATEEKYSTFDRELLSIYLSVKHFRYMLVGREVIYTDHKPLVFAFTRKHDNNTPRQIDYLELISQFTTDIRYIAGRNNVVADTFSRISQINLLNSNDFSGLAEDQFSDPELQSLMGSGSGLELRPMYLLHPKNHFIVMCPRVQVLGVQQTRTTAYHPQSNGAVERFHRHLKSALMAHLPENWLDSLPLVLLGIRSNFKPDLATSSAELVYGTTLKLPGEFFSNTPVTTSTSSFLQMLRHHVRSFRPVPTKHHCSGAVFVSDELKHHMYF